MSISGPRVRDLTGRKRRLSVEVVSGAAFELLASAFVVTLGEAEVPEYEAGRELLERTRGAASPGLLAQLEEIGQGDLWLGFIGQAYESPEPRRVETFLDYLGGADPVAVRRDLVAMQVHKKEAPAEIIDRVAAGDSEALEHLAALCDQECASALRALLSLPPPDTVEKVLDVLRRFDDEVFHGGEDTAAALARDAAEKQALAASMSPNRLVETATNGVTFTMQPEVSGVVLIPSAVTRPWVANLEHGNLRLFVYPVAEEVLSADPDAPSPWMLGFYKALADESRLRILNLLAASPASLSQVAEHLGLAKSTVIHHMRALRTAGLVLITVGAEKEYSLRTQAIPEAGRLLRAYLSGPVGAEGASSESERTRR
ncbi:MAG TPA: metalloregulator ArsR/SmtB family transcription factor [Acidimicrobiia bacterium]|nr:metalloregulator ArsR/SmtB family transcription factor [Acidimicrobiia bacterium]